MRRLRSPTLVAVVLVLAFGPASASGSGGTGDQATPTAHAAAMPKIREKYISFGKKRQHQTVRYAERHYRLHTWHIDKVHVIVEHFTGGTTFQGAWGTFQANRPDLGELPGTCAHFIVDKDGTIYQLVDLDTLCRHTVGLNWTAIGIEMVGLSDKQIMHRPREYNAAQDLTLWLMDTYGVDLGDVIGHNESLTSPYHHERVASWRCQTHDDWNHRHMKAFRSDLEKLAGQEGVPVGKRVDRVRSKCG